MRVLAVCNLFPPYAVGGNEIRFRQILEVLRERHDIRVLTTAFDYDQDRDWVDRSLTQVVPYPKPLKVGRLFLARELWTSLQNYRVARRAIKEFRADVAYVSDLKRVYLGPPLALCRAGVPIVWDVADRLLLRYARRTRFRTLFPLVSLRGLSFEHSIAISEHVRSALVREEVLPETARTINQGVDLARFTRRARDRAGRPEKLLYVGSLVEQKGLHIVIQALSLLRQRGTPHTLTVVGDSGDELFKKRVRDLVASHKLNDIVSFMGQVAEDRVPALYRDHDIFVFSTVGEESLASTPLEAMASGTPVVGTLAGGQKDFFVHGENCLTYNKDDPADLADKILQLNDDSLYRDISDRAHSQIEQNHSFTSYVRKIEDILIDACISTRRCAA